MQEDRQSGFRAIGVDCIYIPIFCIPGFSYDRQITKCGIAVHAFFGITNSQEGLPRG